MLLFTIGNYKRSTTHRFVKNIIEITNPLKKLGINYFSYVELKNDNQIIALINNDDYAKCYLQNNAYTFDPGFKKNVNPGLHLLSLTNLKHVTNDIKTFCMDAMEVCHISTINILIKDVDKNYRRVYEYGSSSLLILDYQTLDAFSYYFHDKAQDLIKKTCPFMIQEEDLLPISMPTFDCKNIFLEQQQSFLGEVNFQHYKLLALKEKYTLSKRELECLTLIIRANMTKQIAHKLQLSNRTIEEYINNLKLKLNCSTKVELIVKTFNEIGYESDN